MGSSQDCKDQLKGVIQPASKVYQYFKEETPGGTMNGLDHITYMLTNLKMGKDHCQRLWVNWSRIETIDEMMENLLDFDYAYG